jgi:protein tyrosine phosphatase
MDDNANLSVLVKCVNVLDACQWIHSSMKEVKSSTVVKCFAHCGVTGIDIAEDDDDDDVPLAELLRLTCPHIADPITTTEDYINIDNDLDANDVLNTDWEETLI